MGGIAGALRCLAADLWRHVGLPAQHRRLACEGRGTSVYCRIADPAIHKLCDLVYENLRRRFEQAAAHRDAFPPVARRRIPARPA